jgi:sec-independent protein translocase protein TatA
MPGGGELIIIVVVILLLFGGKKIPELMRGLGKGVKEFKDAKEENRPDKITEEDKFSNPNRTDKYPEEKFRNPNP